MIFMSIARPLFMALTLLQCTSREREKKPFVFKQQALNSVDTTGIEKRERKKGKTVWAQFVFYIGICFVQ